MMKRRKTRAVRIGAVEIGAENPIAIQSMTTTNTEDVAASARQVVQLARAGAAIVRLTVPSVRAAESLGRIRDEVRAAGVRVPLVADIHYTPNAALVAAEIVEKVRVNPGNFADRPDRVRPGESFDEGVSRVAELFGPLVRRLHEKGAALRIGVNHGSLSERITARYGDSPEGMVQSALEYIAVSERLGFDRVVVSLKSSIPAVTVGANRLFAEKADSGGGRYPLHVGVTEAGSGEEGRVRSAAGIGALLAEGIGDTIRVSLTEDPVREIPAARAILAAAERSRIERGAGARKPTAVSRVVARVALGRLRIGPSEPLAVFGTKGDDAPDREPPDGVIVRSADEVAPLLVAGKTVVLETARPDTALAACAPPPDGLLFPFPGDAAVDWKAADRTLVSSDAFPMILLETEAERDLGRAINRLRAALPDALERGGMIGAAGGSRADLAPALEEALAERALDWTHLLIVGAGGDLLDETVDLAPPLLDNLGCVLVARGHGSLRAAWEILQATRRRITRVEYISCPSCGRTLFDLEIVSSRIRDKTSHLKNVKIAVMGCIVNGPGEMADADFGYVGSGPGRVDLYVGARKVEKSVREEEAVARLVQLIRSEGRWVDPPGGPAGPGTASTSSGAVDEGAPGAPSGSGR